MSESVQLVFEGAVLHGFDPHAVRRDLGQALQLDEPRLDRLFSGRPAILKRGVDPAEAQRYLAFLRGLGADVRVTAMPASTGTEAPFRPLQTETRAEPPGPRLPADAALSLAPLDDRGDASVPGVPVAGAGVDPQAGARLQVTCPRCGLTQPKQLLCRQCVTNLDMALAAQQEEQDRRREERQAALQARRAQRLGRSPDGVSHASAWGIGLSGRLNRLTYGTANVWLWTVLLLLAVGMLQRPSLGRMALLIGGMLLTSLVSMRLAVLRFHDCGRHGWWALILLLPYVSLPAAVLLVLVPGDEDANEYGPPPPPRRRLWLFVALGVLVLSAVGLGRATLGFVERQHRAALEQAPAEDVGGGEGEGEGQGGADGTDRAPIVMDAPFSLPQATAAYRQEYLPAPGHKAFAVSTETAYGWSAGAASPSEALRAALAQCESRRPPYTPECRIVSVNGRGR